MTIRLSIAGVAIACVAAGGPVMPSRIVSSMVTATDTLKTVPAPTKADRDRVEWLERSLAHDSMEGRGLATRGEHRAAVFLAGQMKKIGLKPGGEDKSDKYFQRIPLAMMPPVPASASAGRSGAGGVPGAAARVPRLRMTTLPSVTDWDTVPKDRQRTAVNVIGILPGSDPVLKHEIVIVLSHFDHLGIRSPATPGADSIYNGADDDASGTVAVLEVARLLKQAGKPKRTIVFANMTGEESGMVGTNFWVSHPNFPLSQFVAGLEVEMIGRPDSLAGGPGKAWLTGYDRSTMGDMLQHYGIAILPDRRPEQNFFQRSDNYGLARRGIVAHTLSTFNLHLDYHRVTDDVDKIDFDHMTAVIHSAAEAVRHLADGPKPMWHPGRDPSQPAPAKP